MKKYLLIFCLALLCAAQSVFANGKTETDSQPDPVFGQREILCTIEFPVSSSALNSTARDVLARHVPRIKRLDHNRKLIRIEGFASPEGDPEANYRLSLERARSVESFLRTEHGVSLNHYLTGFGPKKSSGITAAGTRSVQVVIYDNPWGQSDVSVELTNGGR